MKLIQITLITSCLIFTGVNTLNNNKLSSKEEITLPDTPKLYKPYFNTVSPTCPSTEYQVAVSRQAEGQLPLMHTEHCSKCSMGALYEKEDKKICTYCEHEIRL